MKLYQKIIAGGAVVVALVGIKSCSKNIGEEVYRGNINGQEEVYEEGKYDFAWGPFSTKNTMTIKKGDISYILDDREKEISIQNLDFSKDKLEKIVIKTKSGKEDLNAKSRYGLTLDDVHAQKVFELGNKLYNDVRGKIKAKIESEYRATEKQISQF